MAGNEIGAEGAKTLAEVLPRCANLCTLHLQCEWRDVGERMGEEREERGREG